MQSDQVRLFVPSSPEEINAVRLLFIEYAKGLDIDLCFQNFQNELINLPGDYAPPRGALMVAKVGGTLAGCCALRPLDNVDYPNASEMKRLFVRSDFQGCGAGRMLAEAILEAARQADYGYVLLDTLSDMESARDLYQDLGFVEIPPYYHNPVEGAHYLMVTL